MKPTKAMKRVAVALEEGATLSWPGGGERVWRLEGGGLGPLVSLQIRAATVDAMLGTDLDLLTCHGYGTKIMLTYKGQELALEDRENWTEADSCPLCGGDVEELGILGALAHFRCKACGCAIAK